MFFEAMDDFGRAAAGLLGTITGANNPDGTPADGTFLWDDPITEIPLRTPPRSGDPHDANRGRPPDPRFAACISCPIVNRQKYTCHCGVETKC